MSGTHLHVFVSLTAAFVTLATQLSFLLKSPFLLPLLVRPRGGAVSLHSEEAAAAGVLHGQGQRVAAHRARPLLVLPGCRVQGRLVVG